MTIFPSKEINQSVRSPDSHSDTDTSTASRKVQFTQPTTTKSYPISPFEERRRSHASPTGNSSKFEEESDDDESFIKVQRNQFHRGGMRYSDRNIAASRTNLNANFRGSMRTELKFCRNDPIRKSMHATRQYSFQKTEDPSKDEHSLIDEQLETPSPKKVSKSKLTSLWRRLTGPAKKPREKSNESKHFDKLCTYAGVMGDFQRLQKGREIAIIICGSEKVGKSSFINSILVAAALSSDFKIFRKEERFPTKRLPLRIPDIYSLKHTYQKKEWIVDIIEIPRRKHDGNDRATIDAYYRACDGSIFVVNCKRNETSLEVLISAKELKENGVPFVMVGNDKGKATNSQKDIISKLAEKLQVSYYETNLKKAEDTVITVLRNLVANIITQRTENAITNTGIWGINKSNR